MIREFAEQRQGPRDELRTLQQSWGKLWTEWREYPEISQNPLQTSTREILDLEAQIKEKIIQWLDTEVVDESIAERFLYPLAAAIRDDHVGRKIALRGCIDVTNTCRVDCEFCPMRRTRPRVKEGATENDIAAKTADDISPLEIQKATTEEIVEAADKSYADGIREFFIQGGEDTTMIPVVEAALKEIVARYPDMKVTLNLGGFNKEQFVRLRKAGATDYLIKHETANPRLHVEQRGETLEKRLQYMTWAREAGFNVGTGNILGLPGQTIKDLADDIIFMGRFNPTTVSCAPFTPSRDLPERMRDHPSPDLEKVMRFVALLRVCFPDARIPATSNTDSPETPRKDRTKFGQSKTIEAGANGVTIQYTPARLNKYALYIPMQEKERQGWRVTREKAILVSSQTGLPLDLAGSR
ncbi:radical SAM protein [Candidatus Kaiserbacteria bacterium]|nr:radical SAM protein [Candidatus Kaiserbacteria bacterium]